jgi:hypothetical protein
MQGMGHIPSLIVEYVRHVRSPVAPGLTSPASKRLGWWYGDEVMCRNMGVSAEELAISTSTNEVFGISQSCWPVIFRPEYFPD